MSKKLVLLNFVPVAAGGGVQNALSFLAALAKEKDFLGFDVTVVCVSGGEVDKFCSEKKISVLSINKGKLSRFTFEMFGGYFLVKRLKVSLIFTLFGGAPIVCPGVAKISGFAYSNIIQFEVPFWSFLPLHKRLFKLLNDRLRGWLALRSNELIVETDYLAKRAEEGVFKGKKIHVVKMAPSSLVVTSFKNKGYGGQKGYVDILYLSGAHPNKRIHLLGPVLQRLNSDSIKKYRLITTMQEGAPYLLEVQAVFRNCGVESSLKNIGSVAPADVGRLIRDVDALINIALLESFSNNWVEAWACDVPLITTDADWARASCGDAAIYVDPCNSTEAEQRIRAVMESPVEVKRMIEKGRVQLSMLPNAEQKFAKYISIIDGSLRK